MSDPAKLSGEQAYHLLNDPSAFAEWVSGEKQAHVHAVMQDEGTNHDRLCLWAPPEFGKSRQITFRRLAWEILRNPDIRVGIVGSKDQQARDLLKGTAQTLKKAIRKGFDYIKTETDRADRIEVARTIDEPEPTVQAISVGSSFIGARLDLIIADDSVRFEDTWSKAERDRKYKWFTSSECMGRLLDGGRIWFLGNTWHPEDAMHLMVEKHGFYPCRIYAADDPVTLSNPIWPEQFPVERLKQKRIDVGSLSFEQMYFHKAITSENQRFKAEWFEAAFERGAGLSLEYRYTSPWVLLAGLDYGVGVKKTSDETGLVVLEIDNHMQRRLIWVESGRWDSPTLIEKLKNYVDRYPGIIFRPENAGQQALLTNVLPDLGIDHVTAHTTSAATKHSKTWGLEALAVKIEANLYTLPGLSNDSDQVQKLIRQALFYSPADHPGDLLMALWIADSGAASFSGGHAEVDIDYGLPGQL